MVTDDYQGLPKGSVRPVFGKIRCLLPEWEQRRRPDAGLTRHERHSESIRKGTFAMARTSNVRNIAKRNFKEETMADTIKLGLWVRLEAKPGKETDVEDFLRGGLSLVQQEPATVAWFAVRLGKSTFGIFDPFPDHPGRQPPLHRPQPPPLKQK